MSEQVEWGIRHNQGIRTEPSERAARESLPAMMARYEGSHRNKTKPYIVTRTVSDWEPLEESTATPPPPNVPTTADVAGDEAGEAS